MNRQRAAAITALFLCVSATLISGVVAGRLGWTDAIMWLLGVATGWMGRALAEDAPPPKRGR